MGVAGGHGTQEVGVASEWNLWMWLECIGVVRIGDVQNVVNGMQLGDYREVPF